LFKNTKSVFAIYNNGFSHKFGDDLFEKVKMVDIDAKILAPLKSKDYEGFLKLGMEYADVVTPSKDISENLIILIIECSKEKHYEINSEEEEELLDSYYNIYTELAGERSGITVGIYGVCWRMLRPVINHT